MALTYLYFALNVNRRFGEIKTPVLIITAVFNRWILGGLRLLLKYTTTFVAQKLFNQSASFCFVGMTHRLATRINMFSPRNRYPIDAIAEYVPWAIFSYV